MINFSPSLFGSYFLGGFECSAHRRRDGRRLDLIASTRHDWRAAEDYRQLAHQDMRAMRDGLRWHRIEHMPGHYDWTSFLPMLRAAHDQRIEVIWDLCHYGWPEDIDIWKPEFVERFARFAGAAARIVRDETDAVPFYCPINEISYLAWAGGEVGRFHPLGKRRGGELKNQLVRAAIAAIEAIWNVDPRARIVHTDPIINVVANPRRPRDRQAAEDYRCAQYESWDMLAGFHQSELGGKPEYLDIIGANYYPDSQWTLGGRTIPLGHPQYRPLRELLIEAYGHYGRPIFIAETGAEGAAQIPWLRYVAGEVRAALVGGVPVEGICLYPIIHYPGWENDRHCECGLLGVVDDLNHRAVDRTVLGELHRQQAMFSNLFEPIQRETRRVKAVG